MVRTQGRTAGRGFPSSGTSSCHWAAAPVGWFQTPHLLLNLPPHQSQVDTHLAALTPDLTPRSALIRLPGRGGAWVLPPTTRGPPGTRYDSLYLIITLLYSACPFSGREPLENREVQLGLGPAWDSGSQPSFPGMCLNLLWP